MDQKSVQRFIPATAKELRIPIRSLAPVYLFTLTAVDAPEFQLQQVLLRNYHSEHLNLGFN